MGKNNNIIEINGKRYDARTGVMLSHHPSSAHEAHPQPTPVEVKSVLKKPTMSDIVRRKSAVATARRKPATTHTLMRHAVKKPAPSLIGRAELAQKPLASVTPKPSVKKIDPARTTKAARIAKSHLIKHFSPITNDSFEPVPPALPVIPPVQPVRPAATRSKPKTTAELLEHALRQANSHEQAPPVKTRRAKRRLKTGMASAAVVLLVGFIGYQELPNLQLHMASAKAGFNAGLPDYQPAGFSINQLNYSPGVVATQFQSNSDDRSYLLTQKKTDWDSQALRDEFVTHRDKQFQAVQSGGRTIYLYGDNNATWVNGGIWYQIQSHGSLSNQQLIDLATSI